MHGNDIDIPPCCALPSKMLLTEMSEGISLHPMLRGRDQKVAHIPASKRNTWYIWTMAKDFQGCRGICGLASIKNTEHKKKQTGHGAFRDAMKHGMATIQQTQKTQETYE